MLAYWYMGDGSRGIIKKKTCNHYKIILCTESFTIKENQRLIRNLKETFGFHFYLKKIHQKYRIALSQEKDVKRFLKITEPYKISCFDYKWDPLQDKTYMEPTGIIKRCEKCNKTIKANRFNPKQRFCKECRIEHKREYNRRYMRKKREQV